MSDILDKLVEGLSVICHYFKEYIDNDEALIGCYLDQNQQEFEIRLWLAQKRVHYNW